MTEASIVFKSSLGKLISGYIEEMRAVGYKYTKSSSLLKRFDTFAAKEKFVEKKLSKELVLLWTEKRPDETDSTRNVRISIMRGFAKYMVRLGYEAYIFPTAAVKIDRYSYVPYIFSAEELKNIFTICDSYPVSNISPNRHLIISLLFRMLYGCGLRISEAVNLKLKEVDLKQGTLFIRNTKFGKERLVSMAESLTERCRMYAGKVHNYYSSNPFFSPLHTEDITVKILSTNCLGRYCGKLEFLIAERGPGSTMSAILFVSIA